MKDNEINKKIKIAVLYRVIQNWRLTVFQRLSQAYFFRYLIVLFLIEQKY